MRFTRGEDYCICLCDFTISPEEASICLTTVNRRTAQVWSMIQKTTAYEKNQWCLKYKHILFVFISTAGLTNVDVCTTKCVVGRIILM